MADAKWKGVDDAAAAVAVVDANVINDTTPTKSGSLVGVVVRDDWFDDERKEK